MQILGVGTD